MTDITAYGCPPDIVTSDLRKRLKLALDNRRQLDGYIKAVTDELRKRTDA